MTSSARRAPAWTRKGYVILLMVGCAALAFAATTQTWLTVELPEQAVSTADLAVAGSDAATAVTALALVALAGALAASIAGAFARVIVAVIELAAALGIVASSLSVSADPDTAASGHIAEAIGIIGSTAQVQVSVFPAVAAGAGVLLGASSVLLLAAGRYWSRSKRFENAAAGTASRSTASRSTASRGVHGEDGDGSQHLADDADTGQADEQVDEIDSWDQLSRGKDPTG